MQSIDDNTIIATLRRHGAYVTQTRIAVFKVFLQSQAGITVSRIRQLSSVALDRISAYRTVRFFLNKGLIRAVPHAYGNSHYILTEFIRTSSDGLPADQLVYFICRKCGYTELIEQQVPVVFTRPAMHQVKSCSIILEGECDKCSGQEG